MPDKSDKYPWMQFYVGDWLRDTAMCSPLTRGVWIDALAAMHAANRSGELRGTVEQLARACHCSIEEMAKALAELEALSVADVLRESNGTCNEVVTLINRRMQREHKDREGIKLRVNRHRGNGDCNAPVTPPVTGVQRPGNTDVTPHNQNQNQNQRGEPRAHAPTRTRNVGSPGEESKGEEAESNSPPPLELEKAALSPSERITREKELARVEAALDRLKGKTEGGYTLSDTDRAHRASMRERRQELLDILGMKA